MSSEKPNFYYVEDDYLNFLKYGYKKEKKIMLHGIESYKEKKFTFGVVLDKALTVGKEYFCPVSSLPKNKLNMLDGEDLNEFYSNFLYPIMLKEKIIGGGKGLKIKSFIRFDYMFPVPTSELKTFDFNTRDDQILINKEHRYCTSKRAIKEMNELSKKVYTNTVTETDSYHIHCCDFKALEEKHDKWVNGEITESQKCIYRTNRTNELAKIR